MFNFCEIFSFENLLFRDFCFRKTGFSGYRFFEYLLFRDFLFRNFSFEILFSRFGHNTKSPARSRDGNRSRNLSPHQHSILTMPKSFHQHQRQYLELIQITIFIAVQLTLLIGVVFIFLDAKMKLDHRNKYFLHNSLINSFTIFSLNLENFVFD
jgi:hypothetical protein